MASRSFLNAFPVSSVSEITAKIRRLIDGDRELQDVLVEGELSNISRPASGHLYFTLKDETSQLKAVMWRSDAVRLTTMGIALKHGEKVRAHGKISVYEQGGQYQLYCDQIVPLDTVGDLHAQFRQRWDRLEAEGLFLPEIKRPLPPFPIRIGVVTSPSAAAFQDILNVLRRRYPLAEVILSPTPVQGDDAAPQIIDALRRVDAFGVDVILLARGGGSLEDLWCFNDESLARALRETRAPVVTGVGHETDTTLVDGTSDRRAPTPSASAEMITPSLEDLRLRLRDVLDRVFVATHARIDERRAGLDDIAHKLRLVSPAAQIRNYRQRIDELSIRIGRTVRNVVALRRESLITRAHALQLANPANLLARGYAIVTRAADGKRITDAAEVAPGSTIDVQLARGQLKADVKEQITG
jgi:exodeoxyribonuclease VII large subunit